MDRQFSEKETAKILRRAAELQASVPSDASGRISETSLRDAARELGVDPKFIDEAIRQLEAGQGADNVGFFGGPSYTEIDRTFKGTITPDLWEDVLADLRKSLGEQGKVERRGDTYEWTGTGGGTTNMTFVMRQVGDSVRLQATAQLSGAGAVSYIIMMLPTFIGSAILAGTLRHTSQLLWFVIPAFVAAMLFCARMLYSTWAKQIVGKLHAVAQQAQTASSRNPALQAASASPVVETEGQGGLEVQQ